MTLSAHLAAARRHLAAVDRLTRRQSPPKPLAPPQPPEEPATPEEIREAFRQLRAQLAQD